MLKMKRIIAFAIAFVMIISVLPLQLVAAENVSGLQWFAQESSYADHYYGTFQGVSTISENSVRILADENTNSYNHIGFMLKKEVIESLVDEGYKRLSFKATTEAYESNDNPGFLNVYVSDVDVADYQYSKDNGVISNNVDIYYASGSVISIDLVTLCNNANFTDGLKFVLKKAAATGNAAGAPAYLVMSDITLKKTEPEEGVKWFADKTSYANHYYGCFGGLTVLTEDSVRILAEENTTSYDHIGFMLKRNIIKSMIDEGYETVSFKVTTEAYQSNPNPGYACVYASGVKVADYQLSIDNGIMVENNEVDIHYPSGSVVTIDLVKLYENASFKEGLKFVLPTAPAWANKAGAPAYLVLSDFEFTKEPVAKSPFEQMTLEGSYKNYENGEFGGVTTAAENSVQILAKEKNGVSGFMLQKKAIGKILEMGVNEMTFTLNPVAYNSGSVPRYVVLESDAASDYVVNYENVAAKVEGNKLYFEAGTEITLRLEKLYPDLTDANGLKFAMLNDDSWDNGGTTAYLTLANLSFAEKFQKLSLDLVTSNGDLMKYYESESSWPLMTEKSIRGVAAAGFKYVDLSLYRLRGSGTNSELMQEGWEEIVNDLKKLAEELDIEFRQAHSPGYPISGTEEWIATNKRSIDVCKMLGIENLVVHATPSSNKEVYYENNLRYYSAILPYAAEQGVNILCENSTYKNSTNWNINEGQDMREFIKYVQAQTGYTNFHGCWDVGHGHCEGSQYLDMLALGDEMYAIHFADNLGDRDSHLMPYYGTMDIDEVMRALKVMGFDGYFTLETDGTPRISTQYKGPELEGGLNPYSEDRLEQEEIVYQIATYILEKYDCAACASHTYSKWVDDGNGKHSKTCSVCQNVQSFAHEWDAGSETKKPSCKEEGVMTFTCPTCNATKTEPIAKTNDHKYGNWTKVDDNKHKHTCSVCQGEETVDHNWDAGSETKKPSCKEEGITTFTCTECNATKTEPIVKTNDHEWGEWNVEIEPTHQNTGLEKRVCSLCEEEQTRDIPRLEYVAGWQQDNVGWWYQNADGSYPAACWKAINGTWYYFEASGYMVTGWQSIGGIWYYFAGSGTMTTGWKSIGGIWYYFAESGAMTTGWKSIGGIWYYFAGSGAMTTGWKSIGGIWYYFAGSGAMVTGWKAIGGAWYYFQANGAMVANQWLGNYYLQADGSMATNKWIGNYYVGADGAWIP